MSERTIAVVTGTRAEFGLLQSSMRLIREHPDLTLVTVATGMHLSPRHGYTVDDIREAGFTVDHEVEMLLEGDSGRSMAKSLGLGTLGLADALSLTDPAAILVLGDRDEALAAALAGAHMNIPVAHIHGGDAMQGAIIDDSIRHAITKFAHLHFPASPTSAERILELGEEPWRVTTAGAPGLDDIHAGDYLDESTVVERFDLDSSRHLVLVVQHPLTIRPAAAGEQMQRTLEAVLDVDAEVLCIYPNADAGGKRMIEVIEAQAETAGVRTVENVPRAVFLGLLEAADALVGNSSSGIIEAPSFGLPVVNVGPRQEGRERADNVIDVPHETAAIREGVRQALEDESVRERAAACENPYDQGGAADRIVERLSSVELGETLLRKRLTY